MVPEAPLEKLEGMPEGVKKLIDSIRERAGKVGVV